MSQIEQAVNHLYPIGFPKSQLLESVDRFTQLVAQKREERLADLVQNPIWPGIYFRKTGTMRRIEKDLAHPWENIVDFLTRKYRVEQISQMRLKKQFSIGINGFFHLLEHLGIPRLQSFEYRDSRARKIAEKWEDPKWKDLTSNSQRKRWGDQHQELVAKVNSPQVRARRSEILSRWHRENPKESTINLGHAWQANRDEHSATIRTVLGENPATRLTELLIDQNLSYKEAARIIKGVSSQQVRRWAVELGVISAGRGKQPGRYEARYERAREIRSYRQFFGELTPRDRLIVDTLYPEEGNILTHEEASPIFGVTSRERVRQMEMEALSRLRETAKAHSALA